MRCTREISRGRKRRLTLRSIAVLAIAGVAIARTKTEVVVMKNGDRYTCEIVELVQGQLKVKTVNTSGTVSLNWMKVDRIESTQYYAVELSDGRTLAGIISKISPESDTSQDFRIVSQGHTDEVAASQVVAIERSGEQLSGRLSGGVSAGFNYAKGNNNVQYNLNANLNARGRTNEFISALSSTFAGQSGGSNTTRNDLLLQYWKSVSQNWLLGNYDDFLRSNEQQLDLRSTLGALVARRMIRTNRTSLIADAGVVFTIERYKKQPGQPPTRRNAEATLGVNFSIFRFDSTRISAQSMVFPSMTDPGRVRIDTNINGHVDLTHNIYWNVTAYSNYDSRPPFNVPNSDFGINIGVGWSFP